MRTEGSIRRLSLWIISFSFGWWWIFTCTESFQWSIFPGRSHFDLAWCSIKARLNQWIVIAIAVLGSSEHSCELLSRFSNKVTSPVVKNNSAIMSTLQKGKEGVCLWLIIRKGGLGERCAAERINRAPQVSVVTGQPFVPPHSKHAHKWMTHKTVG